MSMPLQVKSGTTTAPVFTSFTTAIPFLRVVFTLCTRLNVYLADGTVGLLSNLKCGMGSNVFNASLYLHGSLLLHILGSWSRVSALNLEHLPSTARANPG